MLLSFVFWKFCINDVKPLGKFFHLLPLPTQLDTFEICPLCWYMKLFSSIFTIVLVIQYHNLSFFPSLGNFCFLGFFFAIRNETTVSVLVHSVFGSFELFSAKEKKHLDIV